MKAAELREMTPAELRRKYADLKKDLFNLRMQHATNQLDNPIVIRETRRDIARVMTFIKQNETKEAAAE